MPTIATILTFVPLVLAMQAIPGPDTMIVVSTLPQHSEQRLSGTN
jgi:threonine/homoserine/homoserine lactone efflux protein